MNDIIYYLIPVLLGIILITIIYCKNSVALENFSNATDPPEINSFDLFDTLVFRINKTPESIFIEMSKSKGLDFNFIKNRKKAEKYSREKTLIDIYNILQTIYKWNNTDRDAMMNLEMDTEFNNIYPIYKNVKSVKIDDIIISDTYLPKTFLVKLLLNKCNLKNTIIATYDGKHKGYIWKQLLNNYNINSHLGDNILSDVKNPNKYGIKSKLCTLSNYTNLENIWAGNNFKLIADCIRFCRLQCPYDDGFFRTWYEIVACYNIPCLLMYSSYIHSISKKYSKIIFSTRDSCYLYYIYKKLYPTDNSSMFGTSRTCYNKSSKYYNSYIEKEVPLNSLIIDMNGTGNSFNKYFSSLKRTDVNILFLNNLMSTREDTIEILNYVRFGSIIDVDADDKFIFTSLEYPKYMAYPIETNTSNMLKFIKDGDDPGFNFSLLYKYFRNCKYEDVFVYVKKRHQAKIRESVRDITQDKNYEEFLDIFNKETLVPVTYANNIKIYIINIEKHTDRYKHITSLMSTLNLKNISIVRPAPATMETKIELARILKINIKNMKCSLTQASHSLTYFKLLLSAPEERIIVLEDDIQFVNSLYDTQVLLNYILDIHPKDSDLIYLEYCDETCNNNTDIYIKTNKPYCTAAIFYPFKDKRINIVNEVINMHVYMNYIATDNSIARLINNKTLNGYEHKILFVQDKVMGSNIKGSKKEQLNLCNNMNNYNRTLPNKSKLYYSKNIYYNFLIATVIIVITIILIMTIYSYNKN
jgi:hypothetical protein